jgi:murein L,D-transpeptidase YcbB/YkuD
VTRRFTSIILAIAVTTVVGCRSTADTEEVMRALSPIVSEPSPDKVEPDTWRDVREFYARRSDAPAWIESGGRYASPRATEAVELLRTAASHGLDGDYGAPGILALHERIDTLALHSPERAASLAHFDVAITTALLQFGRDVAIGRVNPETLDPRWKNERQPPNLVATLIADDGQPLTRWVETIQPQHREYVALLKAMPDAGEARRKRIAINLERWRWVRDDFGDHYFIVNIPEFRLRAIENGRTALDMRVVVGKPGNETPVFSDEMESVVFSPYWNIPDKIVEKETAPAIGRDKNYLAKNNMEILRVSNRHSEAVDADEVDWDNPRSYRGLTIRQRPGSLNALGKVKFLFPNQFDVYFHDTPSVSFFARKSRAFSHGCIRVEQPDKLAQYVLAGAPEWGDARISVAMHSGVEKYVKLSHTVPVHIVYFTAWVDESGVLQELPDVYGLDKRQK